MAEQNGSGRRPHVGSPTSQLVASRDEYREHIEAQDLDAELLTFLAGVVDSIALELLHRERQGRLSASACGCWTDHGRKLVHKCGRHRHVDDVPAGYDWELAVR